MSASPLESMPNSLSAEQAVLGGLMLDNCRWDEVADRIVADDFIPVLIVKFSVRWRGY